LKYRVVVREIVHIVVSVAVVAGSVTVADGYECIPASGDLIDRLVEVKRAGATLNGAGCVAGCVGANRVNNVASPAKGAVGNWHEWTCSHSDQVKMFEQNAFLLADREASSAKNAVPSPTKAIELGDHDTAADQCNAWTNAHRFDQIRQCFVARKCIHTDEKKQAPKSTDRIFHENPPGV